jgi:hypothetical protein
VKLITENACAHPKSFYRHFREGRAPASPNINRFL